MSTASRSFEAKKKKILQDLSLPDEEYTDLSPKGSVDVGIRDLIRDINQLEGLVTTSSCAGRISVFLEGLGVNNKSLQVEKKENSTAVGDNPDGSEAARQFVPTGGKGSGKWQFVSHDPIEIGNSEFFLHDLFGLQPGNGMVSNTGRELRLVRFHFEPMILHIMAESLRHAQPVLAAASSAGFRESGIQSLRCLDDLNACPIVAVRSSGLALESIIGYVEVGRTSPQGIVRSLVSEDYLRMLVSLSNERFRTNYIRIDRFRTKLFALSSGRPSERSSKEGKWEDSALRKERKRAEGLRRREESRLGAQFHDAAPEAGEELTLAFLRA